MFIIALFIFMYFSCRKKVEAFIMFIIFIYFLAAANKLKLLLSFAVGGLLGDVFLHLLPEAWESLDKSM